MHGKHRPASIDLQAADVMPGAGFQQYEQDSYEGGYGDLPSVDDLEVAAAAAAARDEADMGGGLSSSSNEDDEVQTLAVP